MKTLDAVKIMNIAGTLVPLAMLAVIAILAICFIRTYLGLCIWIKNICIRSFFICDYARKRVTGRMIYRRKYALFTINPDNDEVIREMKTNVMGYKGIQRGLLKDKP